MVKLQRTIASLALITLILLPTGCLTSPSVSVTDVERPADSVLQPAAKVVSPEAGAALLEAKLKETPPQRDLISLYRRLKGKSQQPDVRSANVERPDYEIGKVQQFWLSDQQKKTYNTISATLRHKTAHAYFYVEDGHDVPLDRLQRAGEVFETQIYPTVRGYFGSEADPGIDNDPRITILHANFPGPPGYYSSADEYPKTINPYSNEREMIYINLRNNAPGTERYYSTIAHEFQHMIHWNWDTGEDTWVNEGLAELAVRLAGFAPSGSTASFASNPDIQLNAWGADPVAALPHYGASYLFLSYLAEHYGGYRSLKDLVAEKTHGINGVERYLSKKGFGSTFDDVFKDWVIADYVDDAQIDNGRYGYRNADIHVRARNINQLPIREQASVHQHAANYLDLGQIKGDYTIVFTGTTTVKLLDNDAHSGRNQWWSNRGDGMDTTLTREFDLTGLDKATLQFSAWYDIEKDYDYAYVEASTDGGATWKTVQGLHTTEENPNGNSFGAGYTGKSGGGAKPSWVDERVDLSAFAGKKVLVRFEYITDDAYSGPGFAVDDISIPELKYNDDAETEEKWVSNGFVLSSNLVPQRYYVQVIESGPRPSVETVPLNDSRQGRLVVHGDGIDRVVLVVAAAAPATLQPANYEYSVEPLAGN